MTEDEKHYEKMRSLASCCFSAWSVIRQNENYLQKLLTKHWDEPAFRDYMKGLGITAEFAKYRKMP